MVMRPPIPVPLYKKSDAAAIQALARGEADEHQQKRALSWIINNACLTYDFCNQPESERLSAIFDGRRFAGTQIVKLVNINISALKE